MFTKDYKKALFTLARQCACIQEISEEKDGFSDVYIKDTIKTMEESRNALLSIKSALGYTDGLSFMDNAKFIGFSIIDGKVCGDIDKIPKIVIPWLEDESEENRFKYEVGAYLYSHYMFKKGLFHHYRPLPVFKNTRNLELLIKEKIRSIISLVERRLRGCVE
ncbi:MAG: hypothetical protein K6F84_04450 [Lachnospiraceae bacterium]|nr:hypothetical protein [Lachnospiraceae bacterium]